MLYGGDIGFPHKGTFTHARAGAGGGGREIGFNTNHYMCSHMRGRRAEAEREQNPLHKKWVQLPICRVRFETACSKPSLSSRNGRSARTRSSSAPRMCEHTRGCGAGMSKSTRLRSATAPLMCERSFISLLSVYSMTWDNMANSLQTTFSNAFSWIKIFELQLKFH